MSKLGFLLVRIILREKRSRGKTEEVCPLAPASGAALRRSPLWPPAEISVKIHHRLFRQSKTASDVPGVWQRFATNLATSPQLFDPEEIVEWILLEVAGAINKNRSR
jgi:hypothetical protein